MAQNSSAHRRALIVEDEPVVAMGIAADMQGFDLRSSSKWARRLFASNGGSARYRS